jgi:polyisoprenoid-binding protein YceI
VSGARRRTLGIPILAGLALLAGAAASVARGPGSAVHAQGLAAPLRLDVVAERSEVRYRVREQLATLRFPNDAVGATRAIEGGIAVDGEGRILEMQSKFTVELATLRSDEPRRDNYLRRNTLDTDRHPTIVLVPTELRGLRFPLPATGTVAFQLVGNLSIRRATGPTTWEATAAFEGDEVTVRARTAFRFADFDLRIPRVSVVLSVEDLIKLEADLVLRRRP